MDEAVLCIDIGGSSVKAGVFDANYFRDHASLLRSLPTTPILGRNFADVETAVVQAVELGLSEVRADRLGISTTGTVQPDGVVLGAGHFAGYEMIDWRDILLPKFPALRSVQVANDGKASAWAEFSYYRSGRQSHVHFVLGTGVGSSVVVNDELIDGDSGEAGFLGHTVVTNEPTMLCSCERQGCIETVASGPGLVFEYNKRAQEKIDDYAKFVALLGDGDELADQIVQASAHHFGTIIGVLANGINPSCVTFGGGTILGIREASRRSRSDGYFLDLIGTRVAEVAFRRSASTTALKYGMFDNDGGLIGAALLAVQK